MAGTESIRLKREQLERFIDDFETLYQFEQFFEVLDELNSTIIINIQGDIAALENDKADLLNPIFTNDISVTNNIILGGTVDGRDVSVDGSKLDTVETNADVTDLANVSSSLGITGAVAVTDTGTAGNAGKAIKLDGSGLLDGRDIDVDGTKLDTVESGADVTDQSNVTSSLGVTDAPAVTDTGTAGNAGKLIKLDGAGLLDGRNIDVDGAKLDTVETGAEVNTVDSVAGKTGEVSLVKDDVGLENVDNTSDADKPVSSAQQAALDSKFDLVTKNSQTPTTGFSIALSATVNEWLVLNPASALATGTVTMVSSGSASDLQEVTISSTKQISSLTISGNGAAVYGAPKAMRAESSFSLRYDNNLKAWFRVD